MPEARAAMAAKSGKAGRRSDRNKARASAAGGPADLSPVVREDIAVDPSVDRVAAAIYGTFFLFLYLACSPALDSKFALPKSIVLALGVFSLGALLIARSMRGKLAPPPWALLLSLALGAWWIVSTPFALHLPTALDGVYDYYNGLWTHLCWLALFVASLSLPLDSATLRRIAVLITAAIVPVAVVTIVETAGLSASGLKEVSTLGDRVAASALMNFAIPFALIALVKARHWGSRIGIGAVLALFVISEFLSQGRGAWVGLIAAALILAWGLIRSRASWKLVGAGLLLLLVLGGFATKLSPAVGARMATLTQLSQDENLRQRLVIYGAALRGIREHPVAGIGFENFQNSYPAYRSADDRYFFDNIIPTMVHNGYLQTALTNGIPALLLYLALVAGVLRKLVKEISCAENRERQDLLLGFLAALGAYLVQDLVGWLDLALTSIFWVMLGLAMNLACATTSRESTRWGRPVLAAFAALMLLLSLYLLNDRYARIMADAHLARAQALDVTTQWPEADRLVASALARLPGDSRTEGIAGQIHANRFMATHDTGAYAKSRELLEASYMHNPFERMRLINIVALESNALELGRISKASDFAQKAVDLLTATDHDNPGFHEFRARFFAAQGRFDKALEAIGEALRLAPREESYRSREAEYASRVRR